MTLKEGTKQVRKRLRGCYMPIIGARVKELRKKRGITPADITKQLLTSSASLWRWETNKNEPSTLHINQLAEILGTSVDYLLGNTDDPAPPKQELGDLTPMERKLLDAYRHGGDKGVFRLLLGDDE